MKISTLARIAYTWTTPFADPLRAFRSLRGLPYFVRDYLAYRRQPGAERIAFRDMMPVLDQRIGPHEFDAHYLFINAWAARRILAAAPPAHVDVASQTVLSSILAASLPVVFIDYRPLAVHLSGMSNVAGELLRLPLRSDSVPSLSCLHVAEHVGLGRYGDPIDAAGTRKAAAELARVLAPGGNLFFGLPVGRPRVAFNAHRIHSATAIREYFSSLALREFSGVDDRGRYHEHVPIDTFRDADYACAFFWFTKDGATT